MSRPAPALQAVALLALLLARGPAPARGEDAGPLALECPAAVGGLRVADVDGDGVQDVLALVGREVLVWPGARGALPAPAPRHRVVLPGDSSFVDVARGTPPALVVLAASATLRVPLAGEPQPVDGTQGLGWADGQQAVFTDLHPGAGQPEHLAPTASGWALVGPQGLTALEARPARLTTAPGPFLEDQAVITEGLPHLLALRAPGTPAGTPPALWSLAGDEVRRAAAGGSQAWDLSFLPASGQRRLLDLDADGVPEVLHGDGDNRELRLAFFRLPPAARGADGVPAAPPPGDLRPPFAFLKLSGFSLEPAFVDLDGDGRQDIVVTTMEIDGPNVMRALSSGRVTAKTRAFLQRSTPEGLPAYPPQPDGLVESEIGVKIRFGYAGNLDITRSFTLGLAGDLDGDRRKDLVVRTGPDRLAVRAGTADGVWSAQARVLPVPALAPGEELELQAADLDGDGKDELVLHVRAAPGGRDRLLVRRGT
ncbi:MAG: FG-GAP repeat domain-containing protein [Planctomycetia bacterium]